MPDDDDLYGEQRHSPGLLILIAGLSFLLAIVALGWSYFLQSRLEATEAKLTQAQEHIDHLSGQHAEIWRQMRATNDEFGAKLGITQQQIEVRAQNILHQQELADARMARQEAATQQKVTDVSHAVSNVQTDVGGVKKDVVSTQKELASTEQQLHAVVGDLGVQSGLIATNSEQLNYLKHMGDRDYFQFTLHKGQSPSSVSIVKLELKKADVKHSRYTLVIYSDDKKIEKKNRDLDEPLQFYTGKSPMLFEVVVNQIGKNEVTGYLSAPKNAPKPFAP
jgi:septal ring factor EnvC (AmiA/AmiB activator)